MIEQSIRQQNSTIYKKRNGSKLRMKKDDAVYLKKRVVSSE